LFAIYCQVSSFLLYPLDSSSSSSSFSNFDAILVQAKPTEIEKFLDETMDLQNILKRRKESFSETREESSSSFRKDSMERKYSYEFKSSTSVPTPAPLVEKRDYQVSRF
jgi:hypothetical protein